LKSLTTTIDVSPDGRFTYLDLTDELRRAIKDAGVTEGMAVAFCPHTTCALLINEWEDGALEDFRHRLLDLVPDDHAYAHDDLFRRSQNLEENHERPNGQAHVKQMLLSATSHSIPVASGDPMLGRWQRLVFVELDDPKPKPRQVIFHVFGE
jgi:secondary thiamine-phosphate synthase enzyme